MKGLSFTVMVAASVVILCAIEMSYGYKPETWRRQFKLKMDHILGRHYDRFRRQFSDNCTKAYQEVQSDRFLNCYNVINEISDGDVTNAELETYCDNRCTSEIIRVSRDLALYCDAGEVPDQQEIDFLRLICVKDINDDYCYVALDNVVNDKSAPDFDSCDPKAVPCSDVCKEVLHYIDVKLDCCYADFLENGILPSNDSYSIGTFELCGVTYIPAC